MDKIVHCPKCGCNAVNHLAAASTPTAQVYSCAFCRTVFEREEHRDADREPVAIFQRTACPHCQSQNTVVTQTMTGTPKIRYHLCRTCELTFKSRELPT